MSEDSKREQSEFEARFAAYMEAFERAKARTFERFAKFGGREASE